MKAIHRRQSRRGARESQDSNQATTEERQNRARHGFCASSKSLPLRGASTKTGSEKPLGRALEEGRASERARARLLDACPHRGRWEKYATFLYRKEPSAVV